MANSDSNTYWFVGASYGGTDDQTPRFLAEGIWENGYEDKYLDTVRAMQPGERIAIKAVYTQKHDLPFDNRDQTVSVMAIKAIGTITENLGDGRHVRWIGRHSTRPRSGTSTPINGRFGVCSVANGRRTH